MIKIAFHNEKGGVGKTTLATHIGAGLARRGARTLIVDTDAQEANATFFCNIPQYAGIYDLLVRNADWRTVIKPIPSSFYRSDDDSAQPTSLSICGSNIETRNIPLMLQDAYSLQERLDELESAFDWVLIDMSPTPGLLATVINLSSDFIIYPTELEVPSVAGLKASLNHRKMERLISADVGGIVPMMARLNTWEHQDVYNHLKEEFGDTVWEPIPQAIVWAEASGARTSVYAYDPGHPAIESLEAAVSRTEGLAS